MHDELKQERILDTKMLNVEIEELSNKIEHLRKVNNGLKRELIDARSYMYSSEIKADFYKKKFTDLVDAHVGELAKHQVARDECGD